MKFNNWYSSRWAIFLFHILTWLMTLFLPYLVRPVFDQAPHYKGPAQNKVAYFEGKTPEHAPRPEVQGKRPDGIFFTALAMGLNIIWIGLFYLNAYLLIPHLVYQRKLLQYISIQLFFFVAVAVAVSFLINIKTDSHSFRFPMPVLLNIFPFLFIQAFSIAFRMIVDKIKVDKLLKEQETVGLQTELSFLRSQISPHFIFNVLNNLVSLARKKSDLMETSLLRLSGLMRYMLYESDESKVLLTKEIEYLQSYIELQKLRFGDDMLIKVDFQLPDMNYFIEPMLLIPFVENAFKHCSTLHHIGIIDISLHVHQGILNLQVKNSFDADLKMTADHTSGIGLANVKRRLNLLYESQHSLLISESNGMYIVSLQINFP
ncbi:sensor histidine kinase [Flavihumibacter fluvii]|uniref:sensor histidine kinase n=1 Tax=Flavihumibacter fluvii TaxID=2838157 RepID=UPI001BDE28A7|nr:sensor histidine kinase [Flavihumibacter fluvii]ULQ54578.1 sensor histidine kinase [Flavihumibacter fluvii]